MTQQTLPILDLTDRLIVLENKLETLKSLLYQETNKVPCTYKSYLISTPKNNLNKIHAKDKFLPNSDLRKFTELSYLTMYMALLDTREKTKVNPLQAAV